MLIRIGLIMIAIPVIAILLGFYTPTSYPDTLRVPTLDPSSQQEINKYRDQIFR